MDRNKIIKITDKLLKELGHYGSHVLDKENKELDDFCELSVPRHNLRIVRMHKKGETVIYYNDEKVFDRNINITGKWHQVLETCYDEIEILKAEKAEVERIATCNIISKNLSCFVDGMDKLHTSQIALPLTNNILVQIHSNKDECKRDETITSVFYNNEEVFARVYRECCNGSINKEIEYPLYVSGDWEAKIEALKNSTIDETKKVRHINNKN